MAISYEIRSVSFPTTSHPTADKIEKELNDIKTWVQSSPREPSTEAIFDGVLKLSRLYECMHEFFNSLSSTHNEKWMEKLMDDLVEFLDVCGIIRDLVSQIKEHIRDLQCALRRRKEDSSLETCTARYNCFRKKVKKDVKGLIGRLTRSVAAKSKDHDHHHHCMHEVVVRMVMEVREVTVSVFRSLLTLFIMPDSRTSKACKWSLVVSKLIQKTKVACEEHHYQQQERYWSATNGLKGSDAVLLHRCVRDGLSSWSYGKSRLEKMEGQIERMEGGLELIFRRLIRTRASLLNIVSHY
ncbi:uncharacterized protein LOC112515764 [Cynara cardunculus var. scolymus]|uniref:uncharacterized protein LOC112515764 n=1 Tax=Cynara cardunculus var. scolymus TaxID=59895 RepID=UPI000D623CD6|nr:uncharacterized protein LOC112515764 [Cynara cardunculus var. scolymus]